MARPKIHLTTRESLDRSGYRVGTIWQKPQADGRRLTRVAEPGDPWIVCLYLPDPRAPSASWFAKELRWGEGETADAAILGALPKPGLLGSYRALEQEMDRLATVIRAGEFA